MTHIILMQLVRDMNPQIQHIVSKPKWICATQPGECFMYRFHVLSINIVWGTLWLWCHMLSQTIWYSGNYMYAIICASVTITMNLLYQDIVISEYSGFKRMNRTMTHLCALYSSFTCVSLQLESASPNVNRLKHTVGNADIIRFESNLILLSKFC